MPRPKNTVPTVFKNIALPADLAGKVDLFLWSEVEGKIPFGAQQEFFTRLVREFFQSIEGSGGSSGEVAA